MKRSKKEAIRLHREMWNWLYENPVVEDKSFNEKWDWPGWEQVKYIDTYCFLCEYNSSHNNNYCRDQCILNWNSLNSCINENSAYTEWEHAKTIEGRKKYAKLIRDLPER